MDQSRRRTNEDRLMQLDLLQESHVVEAVSVDRIQPAAAQARGLMDEALIEDLANSIRRHGLLSPILVRPIPGPRGSDGRLELVAGERRWRAARALGWDTIPARVVHLDDTKAAIAGLVENVDRENLTAWEEAQAVAELRGKLSEAGQRASGAELARFCGWSEAKVSERLSIADGLPADAIVQANIDLHAVKKLPKSFLLNVSRLPDMAQRTAALATAVRRQARSVELQPKSRKPGRPRAAFTFSAPRSGRLSLQLRQPISQLTEDDARALYRRLEPLMDQLRGRLGE
jgi:ParB/RepB/Spo0J family partition protein